MKILPLLFSAILSTGAFAKGNAPFLAYLLIFPVEDGWDAATVRDVLDMNGDGRTDVAGLNDTGAYVSLALPTGFSDMQVWSTQKGYLTSPMSSDVHKPRFRDVNGDGFPDLVSFGNNGVLVALSDGKKFASPVRWTKQFLAGPVPVIGNNNDPEVYVDDSFVAVRDFDGDAKADLLVWSGSNMHLSISTGNRFAKADVVYTGLLAYPKANDGFFVQYVGDLDGDNKADLIGEYLYFDRANRSKSIHSFATLSDLPAKPEMKFVETYDPPGKVEVGRFTDKNEMDIWTLGSGFFGCVVVANPKDDISCDDRYFLDANVEVTKQSYVGDFDGDGRDDIAYTTGGNFDVVVSSDIETAPQSGDRLLKNKKISNWMNGPWLDTKDVNDLKTYPIFIGDFNADEKPDFARFGDKGVSFSMTP